MYLRCLLFLVVLFFPLSGNFFQKSLFSMASFYSQIPSMFFLVDCVPVVMTGVWEDTDVKTFFFSVDSDNE